MTQDLFAALVQIRHLRSEFVFCDESGKPMHRNSVRKPLLLAIKRSGVKKIRFHDLRHSFASQMVMSGVPIKAVQELLGHSDLKMTNHYSHLSPACREEAVKTLEGKILLLRGQKVDTPGQIGELGIA